MISEHYCYAHLGSYVRMSKTTLEVIGCMEFFSFWDFVVFVKTAEQVIWVFR